MGSSKTQVQESSVQASQDVTPEVSAPEPVHQRAPVNRVRMTASADAGHPGSPGANVAKLAAHALQRQSGAKRARLFATLQRQIGNARLGKMLSKRPQFKIPIGQPGDRYEQEADRVANQVSSGQRVASISRIGRSTPISPINRKEREEETPVQKVPVLRQTEEEAPPQATPVQRKDEEESLQTFPIQRMGDKEEMMQSYSLQRMDEEEKEPMQVMPIQRMGEEEEEVQTSSLQRQVEEEEMMQSSPLQRMEPEEEEVQMSPVQRMGEEETLLQSSPLQRMGPEEEEPLQATPIQRMGEEEEQMQTSSLQRQEEEEMMQGSPLRSMEPEEEEPLQAMSIQRMGEEEDEVQMTSIQRQEEEEDPAQMKPVKAPLQSFSLKYQGKAQKQAEEEQKLQMFSLQRTLQRQAELPEGEEGNEEPWPEPTETEMQAADTVQAAAERNTSEQVEDAGIASRLSSPGGGRPLPDGTKTKMEDSMGMDFSHIRVHDTSQDQDDTKQLGAKAFAYRNHVWLGKGASDTDHKLMAHELTHVVQQGAAVQKMPEKEEPKQNTTQASPIQTTQQQSMPQVSRAAPKVQRAGGILGKVASFAREIPGYHLLSVIIGRDPISSDPVPRTATNVIKGVIGLVPGGNLLYENLNKTGAIDKAGAWLSKQIEKLGFTWQYIKGLFSEAWDALRWYDLALPWRAFSKIKRVFMQPVKRLWNFAKSIGGKIMEFIFEGAMALAGGFGKKVLGVLKQAGGFFLQIIKDPIGFIGNLVKALGKGFGQFSANIWNHLKAGLMGWLFGALSGSGLQMPEQLNLKGILPLVLQVIGVTYQAIRKRIVKVIGEKRMAKVEKTVTFVTDLVTRGPMAAWEMITNAIGNLKDMVLGAIKNWVVTKIVKSAIVKLVSMFNPAGAIIQAAMAIYNTVMFFIERAQQISEVVTSVFKSIGKIATGAVGAAANFIEQTMVKTLPVIISFLGRLLGLGGIGEKIRGIIKKIQKPIGKAIGKVVGFVVGKVKKLFSKGKQGTKKTDDSTTSSLVDFKVDEPAMMSGERHSISLSSKNKKSEFIIKSNPEIFHVALRNAITDVSKSNMSKEDKNWYTKILNKMLEAVLNIPNDINKNKGKILKRVGKDKSSEEKAISLYAKGRIAELANQLESIAKKANIKSLNDFYKDPPNERYIPGHPNQEKVGKFIRSKLYDNLGWDKVRESFLSKNRNTLMNQIISVQQSKNKTKWALMKQQGKVEKNADIVSYNPRDVLYEVDHIEPIVKRWNDKGRNGNDTLREKQMSEESNLQYVTREYNRSKGGSSLTYTPHVGKNFVSIFADGGINGALKINDKHFLDAAGKPLS